MVGAAPERIAGVSSAKDDILHRIRGALRHSPNSPFAEGEPHGSINGHYRRSAILDVPARIDLFINRLHDYEAAVHRSSSSDIAAAIAEVLKARGKRGLLVPRGLPGEWLPEGFQFTRDNDLSYDAIDRSEGVLTACAGAVALTGTIVLRHSAGEGRRALTLIPDYHLCIVHDQQVVETVPEAIEQMARLGPVPVTTVSGPSATSDIEMTRVKGVHGPRTLEIILVGEVRSANHA
jgi:L-lactate dehydrogenase complex protein LldG